MTETVLLGTVALRTRKKLYWDSQNMKTTNVPEADRYIKNFEKAGDYRSLIFKIIEPYLSGSLNDHLGVICK